MQNRMANAFINKPKQPTDSELAAALGPAKTAWDQLLSELASEHGVNESEWKCYSAKWGWSLRAKHKERTIVWLSPNENSFTVLFMLGGKAMQAARRIKWPQRIVRVLDEASKYPEGSGVRLEVKSSGKIPALKKLAVIKLAI